MRRRLRNRLESVDAAIAATCVTLRRLAPILAILGAAAVGCTPPRGEDRQTHADSGAAASTTQAAPPADPFAD